MDSRDKQKSINWAIASLRNEGVGYGNLDVFDLVNMDTCRGHQLFITEASVSIDLGASFSLSHISYNYFRTKRPVSFEDFDGTSAGIYGASAVVYSSYSLTIYDWNDSLLFPLAITLVNGFGFSAPSFGAGIGLTHVKYGNGIPANSYRAQCALVLDMPFPDDLYRSAQIRPRENPLMKK